MHQSLHIAINGPTVISSAVERPKVMHLAPKLYRCDQNRLLLTIGKDRDCIDHQRISLISEDAGATWREDHSLPAFQSFGPFPMVRMSNGTLMMMHRNAFASDEANIFLIPTWYSQDGGRSWGRMQLARMENPFAESMNIYDPPAWWLQQYSQLRDPDPTKGHVLHEPPVDLKPLLEELGYLRTPAIWDAIEIEPGRLLGLIQQGITREPAGILAVESTDEGHTWHKPRIVAQVGQHHLVDYKLKFNITRNADGFSEPSVTRLPNGEFYMAMRLGSWHPLYSAQSPDGRTWSDARRLPIHGIKPTVLSLSSGVLALLAGRPDLTLNFSMDQGRTWSYQIRLFQDDCPPLSTHHNATMVEINPNQILLMHDVGRWRSGRPPGPDNQVLGYIIEIEYAT